MEKLENRVKNLSVKVSIEFDKHNNRARSLQVAAYSVQDFQLEAAFLKELMISFPLDKILLTVMFFFSRGIKHLWIPEQMPTKSRMLVIGIRQLPVGLHRGPR